jgi:bifunctional non-homologous end joining protein LigD
MVAFDLIELEGEDLRRSPIESRKRKLAKLVRNPHLGIVLNEYYEGDGEIIFRHACKLNVDTTVLLTYLTEQGVEFRGLREPFAPSSF